MERYTVTAERDEQGVVSSKAATIRNNDKETEYMVKVNCPESLHILRAQAPRIIVSYFSDIVVDGENAEQVNKVGFSVLASH